MDDFHAYHVKCLLPLHAEINRHLIHVENEIPVMIMTREEWAHEIHVVYCLSCNALGLALCFICAHTIHARIGMHESLHCTAPSNKVLALNSGERDDALMKRLNVCTVMPACAAQRYA